MPLKPLLLALLLPTLAAPAQAEITVADAYARSGSPMAKSGAAYMVLANDGDTEDRLIGVRSDAAARVEIHTHKDIGNGVMQMVEVEGGLVIPAHGTRVLERGGDHAMLMGLAAPFVDGHTITLTLQFETADEMTIEVPVNQSR